MTPAVSPTGGSKSTNVSVSKELQHGGELVQMHCRGASGNGVVLMSPSSQVDQVLGGGT